MPNLIIIDGAISAAFVSTNRFSNGFDGGTSTPNRLTSHTFTSQTLAVGKLLVGVYINGNVTGTITSAPGLTVNGVSATALGSLHTAANAAGAFDQGMQFYTVDCAATSGNVVISPPGTGAHHFAFVVYALTGGVGSISQDSRFQVFASGTNGFSTSISAASDSCFVGFFASGANNITTAGTPHAHAWSGTTKDTTDTAFGEGPCWQNISSAHTNVAAPASLSIAIDVTISATFGVFGIFLMLNP